ncbi:Endoribonuclease L-PSP family protein [Azotobacter vinelandii CA]|uniref:Endoribonuclease L-PSP family protein n=2 Tax=Azotobacter vinelandii TaxID=354 RepID=C1DJZ6_AZOVD|nr:RidA family protein [Azotobacter vinelandii]ACO80901.1 Endoribonuclease L-PSP family protein [Azotobacter vinelandii DJ]AGK15857.1 Endoribonuclease L-PSP family protein [Azotobacter vinelandii CA]AGK22226.1 Endoribonuclease L-PSP family protein [Azotobacter vinelandii CA6]WKN21695.1 RidA family protein [Azotobacter vinelandii]SFX00590.1 Enamine deaminase RidA, house cleaning of reactive enamine intermediates, YjgF/YER057c/UK114 family [Azotobacter vinelandii]
MSIRRLRTEARYSEIVVHGGTVYLAGQLADDYGVGIEEQTRQTLAGIDRLLAEAGTDKSRLLSVTIYLKDMVADYAGLNAVWDAWLPAGCAPARACVEAGLYDGDARVEMSVVAALP